MTLFQYSELLFCIAATSAVASFFLYHWDPSEVEARRAEKKAAELLPFITVKELK